MSKRNLTCVVTTFIGCVTICSLSVFLFLRLIHYHRNPSFSGGFPTNPAWIYEAQGKVISTPVESDGVVFIQTPKSIIALDSQSGRLLWETEASNPTDLSRSPVIASDLLIAPVSNARIMAISASSGKLVWVTDDIEVNRKNPGIAVINAMVTNKDSIFVARYSWKLTSYDMETGQIRWEVNVPDRYHLYLFANGQIVILGAEHTITGYDADSGDILWEKEFDGIVGELILDNGIFYIAQHLNPTSLLAMDAVTQEVLWSLEEAKTGEIETFSISGSVIYAGSNRLIAISKERANILWKSKETGLLEIPVVSADKIFVRNREDKLFIFNRETGIEIGRMLIKVDSPLRFQPYLGPLVVKNLLVIPFGDHRVYAFYVR